MYEKSGRNQEEIIQDNLECNTRLKLSNEIKDEGLPIMHWIHEFHKNPVSSNNSF